MPGALGSAPTTSPTRTERSVFVDSVSLNEAIGSLREQMRYQDDPTTTGLNPRVINDFRTVMLFELAGIAARDMPRRRSDNSGSTTPTPTTTELDRDSFFCVSLDTASNTKDVRVSRQYVRVDGQQTMTRFASKDAMFDTRGWKDNQPESRVMYAFLGPEGSLSWLRDKVVGTKGYCESTDDEWVFHEYEGCSDPIRRDGLQVLSNEDGTSEREAETSGNDEATLVQRLKGFYGSFGFGYL